jgi:tRNA/rRNA methyltransferase
MGVEQLVVVKPGDCNLAKILKMATYSAIEVVEQMQVFDDLRDALGPFNYVVGTTARRGERRQVIRSPFDLVKSLAPISQNNRVAILFGPENRGLSNEEIRFCHRLVNIPTHHFSSINLAQAVMIICYELFTTHKIESSTFVPRLASRHELDGMYDQLKDILVRISYINSENPDFWMNKLRYFFTRLQLRAREVSIIRGICRQINWYAKKCYDDGVKKGEKKEKEFRKAIL